MKNVFRISSVTVLGLVMERKERLIPRIIFSSIQKVFDLVFLYSFGIDQSSDQLDDRNCVPTSWNSLTNLKLADRSRDYEYTIINVKYLLFHPLITFVQQPVRLVLFSSKHYNIN